MTIEDQDERVTQLLSEIEGVRDSISVRRVFGDPQTVDGVTIVPVARVAGGAGAGGGRGGTDADDRTGDGFGTGFGLGVRPVGVYEVRDGQLRWRPTVDVDRIVQRVQALAAVGLVCATVLRLRRRRA